MKKEQLENFDKFAQDYKEILDKSLELGGETGEYFSQYKANYIARRLTSDFSGKILDYGCGIGILSEVLVKHFPQARIDGFDVSVASIGQVPDYLKKNGQFTSDMSLLANDYDAVIIANVLHHIEAHQRSTVISALHKLIKSTGKIIIFEHNPLNPVTCKIVRESPLDKGVVLLPSAETLSYLTDAGFSNNQLTYIVFFPKFLSAFRWLEPFLSWLPLGAQYVAVGHC
jgi:2-polyprenyl-3-methyl-5-hydroxy-6-metoxy-1,4-benzoquinol methylase